MNAGIDQLVSANRSTLDDAVSTDDGHPHTEVGTSEADVASAAVVSVWSWRYDDPHDRLAHTLAGLATTDTITASSPSRTELERRRAVGEVVWSIATPTTSIVHGTTTTVTVDIALHTTTSTTPETISHLTVDVHIARGDDGWVVTRLEARP